MHTNNSLGVIVLAGGKRALNEDTAPGLPKLLENVSGIPVISYVLEAALGIMAMPIAGITTIISTRYEERLTSYIGNFSNVNTKLSGGRGIKIAIQPDHRGTADAIVHCIKQSVYPDASHVMILLGDQPLITSQDLDKFCIRMIEAQTRASILTFSGNRNNPDYKKCGVVHHDDNGNFTELKARTEVPQNGDEELHAGPYLFEGPWLRGVLKALAPHHAHPVANAPEFHLYEALLAALGDTGVSTCLSDNPEHFLGVDTLNALKEVRKRITMRKT